MHRLTVRLVLALAACTASTAVVIGSAEALPPTELLGDGGTVIPLKDAAMITREKTGYRYRAGQQDSNLTVTLVDGRLRYADTGTKELRSIPRSCTRLSVDRGIAASCRVPARFVDRGEMFLEIWPRLGDDVVDGSTLPAMFRMWVLADAGRDVVRTGAGDDFVNGAQDDDRVYGGAGNDWLRTGIDDDLLDGGSGNDQLVGLDGNDTVITGTGNDLAACGAGRDNATVGAEDKAKDCESVSRS